MPKKPPQVLLSVVEAALTAAGLNAAQRERFESAMELGKPKRARKPGRHLRRIRTPDERSFFVYRDLRDAMSGDLDSGDGGGDHPEALGDGGSAVGGGGRLAARRDRL